MAHLKAQHWCWRILPRLLAVSVAVLSGCPSAADSQGSGITSAVGQTFQGRVTGVVDGDTIVVLRSDRETARIRLFGIDCPEKGKPFAEAARRFTRVLMFDRVVDVFPRGVDRYGRVVARVSVDGVDASEALVQSGLAWEFRRYSDDPRLRQLEQEARVGKRGVWQGAARDALCPPAQRCERPNPPTRGFVSAAVLHGNVRSFVYHEPTCPNYTCGNCTRVFTSSQEATAAGYRPAGDCHPR